MNDVKILHLGLTILLSHFMIYFLDPLSTCLDLKTTNCLLFLIVSCFFYPWAAVIEWIRIRIVPSLTSYQLILSVPESRHKKTGALLVGNPSLEELEGYRGDLSGAQKEVESIALIVNTIPLIVRQATKAEVMRRMSSVGVILSLPSQTSTL